MPEANQTKTDFIDFSKTKNLLYAGVVIELFLVALLGIYSNHFHNGFAIDDQNIIVDNPAIKSLNNIGKFFLDARTFSTLPYNQNYMPFCSVICAIDYWLAGNKLDVFYFHVTNFLWFLFVLFLLFCLIRKIFSEQKHKQYTLETLIAGAFAVTWFAFNPAIAQTINYISGRYDIISTAGTVGALCWYIYFPGNRKYLFYLLPMIVGFLTEEISVIFMPILFFYILFFEKDLSLSDVFHKKNMPILLDVFKKTLPALILGILLFIFNQFMSSSTLLFNQGGWDKAWDKAWVYPANATYVFIQYIKNFFTSNDLTAYYGWKKITSITDLRFILRSAVIIAFMFIAFIASKKKQLKPIAFGILWFYLALLPTSIIPIEQPLADRRTFFPFMGLTISCTWMLVLLIRRITPVLISRRWATLLIALYSLLFLGFNAYSTHSRNKVWKNEETLLKESVDKAPDDYFINNWYGVILMNNAKYIEALKYFEISVKLNPTYPYVYANIELAHELILIKTVREGTYIYDNTEILHQQIEKQK